MTFETLLTIAGLLHFALIPASLSVPRVMNWRRELQLLSPLSRQIVWVHGGFIAGLILAFGILTLVLAEPMAAGRERTLTGVIGAFWLARVLVQLFYYPPNIWPAVWWARWGRHALTLLFTYWATVYLMAFWFCR